LEGSSLATEASHFDFTIADADNFPEVDDEEKKGNATGRPFSRRVIFADNVINKHQCMDTLVRMIRYLNSKEVRV